MEQTGGADCDGADLADAGLSNDQPPLSVWSVNALAADGAGGGRALQPTLRDSDSQCSAGRITQGCLPHCTLFSAKRGPQGAFVAPKTHTHTHTYMKLDLSSDCNSYRIVTGGLGFWKLNNERAQNRLLFSL